MRNLKIISLLTFAFIAMGSVAKAQVNNPDLVPINGSHIKPTTAILVEVIVKQQSVIKGPYARYSSDMLGVAAPLSDKKNYTIEGIRISTSEIGNSSQISKKGKRLTSGFSNGNQTLNNNFVDMGITAPYIRGGGNKTVKSMAQEAADAIFTLRDRRFDLVTGKNYGEGGHGEGIAAMIEEMSRIEKEYLDLFLGKSNEEYLTYQYEIVPVKGTSNYIVCRFSETNGISNELNVSGAPLMLTITPQNSIVVNPLTKAEKRDATSIEKFIIPEVAQCKVTIEDKKLVEKRVKILQLGEEVEKVIAIGDEPVK